MDSFLDMFEMVKNYCLETKQITDVAFNVWIKPIQPFKFEDGIATLFVKSDFQKNIILDKYIDLLNDSFNQILGFYIQIKFITEKDLKSENLSSNNNLSDSENKSSNDNYNKFSVIENSDILNSDENNLNIDLNLISNENKNQELQESFNSAKYEYTFDTFIVGNSNNFAYAACRAVSQSQSGTYNPLFIYGPSGLGKTHLLSAIRHYVKEKNSSKNVIYVTGESFTNELISSFINESTHKFHEKYRKTDILLVDDVQFIAGKERTQEEFFYTFNELYQLGKQIVLTSDRPPKDIKTLEDRLRTRFEWGLITDISIPDFETRMAVIKRKAELLNIEIPSEVSEFIAIKLKSNIRQLEGAVKKIKAYKLLAGSPPSIPVAQNVIRDILNDNQPTPVTVEKIINEVSKTYGVTPEDIRSTKRSSPISTSRQISIYIVREITQMPLSSIGEEFAGRDHSTIIYAISQVEKNMKKDKVYKETIEDIINNIRNK